MNLKQSMGRNRKRQEAEVDILPVMNIFLLLIPFLLLTAVFVRLAVIDITLPSLGKGGQKQQEQQKDLVLVILAIKESGFQLKSPGFKFDPINKNGNNYNYQLLIDQLKEIKVKYAIAEDVIISPEANVKYDIIIKAMDRCRETGFPNVSLAG